VKILVLGGYGNTGRFIVEGMLRETAAEIIVAGRNKERAEAARQSWAEVYGETRVTARQVDAGDAAAVRNALADADLVVAASSTAAYAGIVARTALDSGADYLDIQYSSAKTQQLESLQAEIIRQGRCFITDAGFHPGLPAALVRSATGVLTQVRSAWVSSLLRINWPGLSFSESTRLEFAGELKSFKPFFFQNGEWRTARFTSTKDFKTVLFEHPGGVQLCAPMFFEELRSLPEGLPGLQDTGFYIAGFNRFTDNIVMPFGIAALKLFPKHALKPVAGLLWWSLRRFSRPPYGTWLKLEALGMREGQNMRLETLLYHDDGYLFTAIPIVACLRQYLDGSIRKPGLWRMGNLVQPEPLLKDMERMGITIRTTLTPVAA